MEKKIKCLFCVLSDILLVMSMLTFFTITAKASGTVDDFVERCYTVTLDRGSDPDGFADWKGQLLNGKAVGVHVAYGFLFSEEYTNKNKSNEDYVKDLYMLFMGREPDEAGFNDWVGQLNDGKSRVEVYAGFANSQEFYNICNDYGITAGRYIIGYDRATINNVNLFVERMYKICLGRIGDKEGQKNWAEQLINKQITGSDCAYKFIFSQEYSGKGLSDEEFVENLYLAMMGRASDEGGKANWLEALKCGKTRDEVFEGFVNSSEFASICNNYNINKGNYIAQNTGVYNPSKLLLFDDVNIKIYVRYFRERQGGFGQEMLVDIENNSDEYLSFDLNTASINGNKIEGYFSAPADAHSTISDTITFFNTDLHNIGVYDANQIYHIELSFNIRKLKSNEWSTYLNTDVIPLDYDGGTFALGFRDKVDNNQDKNSNNNKNNNGNTLGKVPVLVYSEERGYYYEYRDKNNTSNSVGGRNYSSERGFYYY